LATFFGILINTSAYFDLNVEPGFAVNVFWSIYNIAILLLAVAVCIELPQRREEVRLPVQEQAVIQRQGAADSVCTTVRYRQESLAIEAISSHRDRVSRQRAIAGQIRRQVLASAARQTPNAVRCPVRSLKGSRRYGKIVGSRALQQVLFYPAQKCTLPPKRPA
jgi:hypothetical protein